MHNFFSVHLLCRNFFAWLARSFFLPESGIVNTFKTFCTLFFLYLPVCTNFVVVVVVVAILPCTDFFWVSPPPITF